MNTSMSSSFSYLSLMLIFLVKPCVSSDDMQANYKAAASQTADLSATYAQREQNALISAENARKKTAKSQNPKIPSKVQGTNANGESVELTEEEWLEQAKIAGNKLKLNQLMEQQAQAGVDALKSSEELGISKGPSPFEESTTSPDSEPHPSLNAKEVGGSLDTATAPKYAELYANAKTNSAGNKVLPPSALKGTKYEGLTYAGIDPTTRSHTWTADGTLGGTQNTARWVGAQEGVPAHWERSSLQGSWNTAGSPMNSPTWTQTSANSKWYAPNPVYQMIQTNQNNQPIIPTFSPEEDERTVPPAPPPSASQVTLFQSPGVSRAFAGSSQPQVIRLDTCQKDAQGKVICR